MSVPVLGVLPYIDRLGIDDEDSVSLDDKNSEHGGEIKIAVVRLSKISNFTDFAGLDGEPDVELNYATTPSALDDADLIILPGSKNTSADLLKLRAEGFDQKILQRASEGTAVIGICGGYQMLGDRIFDPHHAESDVEELDGLGLLPVSTTFAIAKLTRQITLERVQFDFLGSSIDARELVGYEIHAGETRPASAALYSANGNVFGTYVHGIFDNDDFRRQIINAIRLRKGLASIESTRNRRAEKQAAYDRLARIVRDNLDIERIKKIAGISVG